MSHRRDRSASPDRSHKRSRRDRDDDDDDRGHRDRKEREQTIRSLSEVGAKEISVDDYLRSYSLKAAEFKRWLREEKGKYLDELSGESARKYFKKFVKQWNNLTLPPVFYRPVTSTAAPSSSQTAYKWSFASNRSKVDKEQLAQAREDVDRLTNNLNPPVASSSRVAGPTMPSSSRSIGPSMPPNVFPSTMFSSNHADRQFALEEEADRAKLERKGERNKLLARAEELVPRTGGKEGKMEERRATNAVNKEFRDRDPTAGMEISESTLMGADGGFQAALAARNAAAARRTDKRAQAQNDRQTANNERFSEMKAKDNAQMEMFKQLAKARFG